jgi:pimeloyl-ACP methyl ester carboxylesterase
VIFEGGGVSIAYDDVGAGSAVLFVHGHPFNRTMWDAQVAAVRWRYRAIVPDMRGYGGSSAGGERVNTQETMAQDLARLLDHVGVTRVCVVGLSMGGQVAMEFARAFPERTAGVVLAATFPQAETAEGVVNRNRMADRLEEEGVVPAGSEMLVKLIGPSSLKRAPGVAAKVFGMICATDPAGAAAAVRGRALRRDYRESLALLKVPCMVVVGTEDGYTTVDEARAMHEGISSSRLEVFERIGHMPNLEDEDRFNRCLHEFLETVVW